jgi:hypothetical protein
VNRPDQRVANESGDEEGGENVKYQIVDIIARNAFGHACVMQVIDEHRTAIPAVDHAVSKRPWIAYQTNPRDRPAR